jgi:hypothetical protein
VNGWDPSGKNLIVLIGVVGVMALLAGLLYIFAFQQEPYMDDQPSYLELDDKTIPTQAAALANLNAATALFSVMGFPEALEFYTKTVKPGIGLNVIRFIQKETEGFFGATHPLRPLEIFLPLQWSTNFNNAQRAIVLIHELSHLGCAGASEAQAWEVTYEAELYYRAANKGATIFAEEAYNNPALRNVLPLTRRQEMAAQFNAGTLVHNPIDRQIN